MYSKCTGSCLIFVILIMYSWSYIMSKTHNHFWSAMCIANDTYHMQMYIRMDEPNPPAFWINTHMYGALKVRNLLSSLPLPPSLTTLLTCTCYYRRVVGLRKRANRYCGGSQLGWLKREHGIHCWKFSAQSFYKMLPSQSKFQPCSTR